MVHKVFSKLILIVSIFACPLYMYKGVCFLFFFTPGGGVSTVV